MPGATLKELRRRVIDDRSIRGARFGEALADAVDGILIDAFDAESDCVLVALGSYARRELCPGSDLDVLLVLPARKRLRRPQDHSGLAERIWYPLWDAGFITGHAARTVAESLTLASTDIDALTAMMHVRVIAGNDLLAQDLHAQVCSFVASRSAQVIAELSDGATARRSRHGAVAEMLDPNLKDGSGGLRDIHSLGWANSSLGGRDPNGHDALIEQGVIRTDDVVRLKDAASYLLNLRVELHRVNGGKSDLLVLQDQDAVAEAVDARDADVLVRELAAVAREVAWITKDVFGQLGRDKKPRIVDRQLEERLGVKAGRVFFQGDTAPTALEVLVAAAHAAELDIAFDRTTLDIFGSMAEPKWDVWERAAFGRLLRSGRRAISVFEALDHAGVLTQILPEWQHVRSLPQRNAYHKFTVDRHLLEAVADCADLLDLADAPEPRPFDGVVARACRRPDLLLLSALLHDIGKGLPGDHSAVGAEIAEHIARRMHLDSEGVEILVWLGKAHLLMADTATRRDLSDEETLGRFVSNLAGDPERLRLLYLLTIGDSLATGHAAWSNAKASLCRDLFMKAAAFVEGATSQNLLLERCEALREILGKQACDDFLAVMPKSYVSAFEPNVMAVHHGLLLRRELVVSCVEGEASRLIVTVAAADRAGLLATVAGALTVCGLAVHEASLFSTTDGMALDVFQVDDSFGRVADRGVLWVESTLGDAFTGIVDIAKGVATRQRYDKVAGEQGPVVVALDLDASSVATVIEVHCDDRLGLLYELAQTFTELGVDVTVAKVQTLGARVVDTFYIRDSNGRIEDADRLTTIEQALRARLAVEKV